MKIGPDYEVARYLNFSNVEPASELVYSPTYRIRMRIPFTAPVGC